MDDESEATEVAEFLTKMKDALPKSRVFKPFSKTEVIILSTSSDESKASTPKDNTLQVKVTAKSQPKESRAEKLIYNFADFGTEDSVIDLRRDECSEKSSSQNLAKSSPSWRAAQKTVKKEPSYPKVKARVVSAPVIEYMQQLNQNKNGPRLYCKHCKKTLIPRGSKCSSSDEIKYYRGTGTVGTELRSVMHLCSEVNKMIARSLKKPYRHCKIGCQGSCLAVLFQPSGAVYSSMPITFTSRNIRRIKQEEEKKFHRRYDAVIKSEAPYGLSTPPMQILRNNKRRMSLPPLGYYISYENSVERETFPLLSIAPTKNTKKKARKRKREVRAPPKKRRSKYKDYGMLRCKHCKHLFTKQRGDGYKQYQTCKMKNSTQHLCTATNKGKKQVWRSLTHTFRGCTLGCKKACIEQVKPKMRWISRD